MHVLPLSSDPSIGRGINAGIGVTFVLLSSLAFASTPAFAQLAFAARLNGVSLVSFRCLIAAMVLWMLARAFDEPAIAIGLRVRLFLLGALLFGPQMALYFAALQRLDTSITVAVVYVYPAVVALIVAIRLRRPPPLTEVMLLVLALVGVGVIALVHGQAPNSGSGMVLAAVTAVIFAIYVLASDALVRDVPPILAASVVLAGSGFSALLIASISRKLALPNGQAGWLYLGLHGLVIVPVGLASYYAGLKRLGATRASVVDTSQPAIASVIGVAALGEHLEPLQILGIMAIVIAVLGLPILAAGRARRHTVVTQEAAAKPTP